VQTQPEAMQTDVKVPRVLVGRELLGREEELAAAALLAHEELVRVRHLRVLRQLDCACVLRRTVRQRAAEPLPVMVPANVVVEIARR
jgi:hypothetical protein